MSSGACQAPIILSRVRDNSCSCIENFLKFIHHELWGTSQKTAAVVNSTRNECLNQSSDGVLVTTLLMMLIHPEISRMSSKN